ncbi:MAG TPA: Gfo/Idh/MocA family oxidoreductase [Gemmatimonadaceae bacterium]
MKKDEAPLPDVVTRREFVVGSAKLALGAAVAPMIVPRHVLGRGFQAPSDTLNIACIGIGGMGMSNMNALAGENIVAVCDVDYPYVERSLASRLRVRPPGTPPAGLTPDQARAWSDERARQDAEAYAQAERLQRAYVKAAKHADYREMLDTRKDIDAVVVATPDHMHAHIANRAMHAGRHVYVQKPLTYSVHEARTLARTARETKVVTQMGNQGHSFEGTRRINELVAAGVIGPVRSVHVWTDRPARYWAQGIPRPNQEATAPAGPPRAAASDGVPPRWSMRTVEQAVLKAMAENPQSPPAGLNWDLFLGAAPAIPYHPVYHPFSWRGWTDFGVSAIGDMGAHLIDQPYWALGLTLPTSVSASSTAWGGPASNPASYPLASTVEYEFPARGAQPSVRLYWYDGGLMPPRPPFLPDDVVLPRGDGGGGVFVGDRGIITYSTYGNDPQVYPAALASAAAAVPKTFPRVELSHEMNWVEACKGRAAASSPIEYAASLTEVMLLGIVALRAGQGRKILYDGAAMRVINVPEANAFLTREYRAGWAL